MRQGKGDTLAPRGRRQTCAERKATNWRRGIRGGGRRDVPSSFFFSLSTPAQRSSSRVRVGPTAPRGGHPPAKNPPPSSQGGHRTCDDPPNWMGPRYMDAAVVQSWVRQGGYTTSTLDRGCGRRRRSAGVRRRDERGGPWRCPPPPPTDDTGTRQRQKWWLQEKIATAGATVPRQRRRAASRRAPPRRATTAAAAPENGLAPRRRRREQRDTPGAHSSTPVVALGLATRQQRREPAVTATATERGGASRALLASGDEQRGRRGRTGPRPTSTGGRRSLWRGRYQSP